MEQISVSLDLRVPYHPSIGGNYAASGILDVAPIEKYLVFQLCWLTEQLIAYKCSKCGWFCKPFNRAERNVPSSTLAEAKQHTQSCEEFKRSL